MSLVPQPTVKYTGIETCGKCGATAAEILTGYDTETDWLLLHCACCNYKWHVFPMDSP